MHAVYYEHDKTLEKKRISGLERTKVNKYTQNTAPCSESPKKREEDPCEVAQKGKALN